MESIFEELEKRAAEVHTSAVTQRIKQLTCPTSQKLELLDAGIETAKTTAGNRIDEPVSGCSHSINCQISEVCAIDCTNLIFCIVYAICTVFGLASTAS